MQSPSPVSSRFARYGVAAVCAAIAFSTCLTAAVKRPIKKPTFDPSAASVELFEGIDKGQFDVLVVPKSSMEGNVFITNNTNKPLTVKLPSAVAAVQVLKQGFGGAGVGGAGRGGMGVGGMGAGGMGGMGGGMGGMGGMGGQAMGGGMGMGGMGGGMMGGMGGMGGGMGMYSIPAEKVIQVPLKSVCLNHGKPEPRPQMTYKLVKLDSYTKDPVLQELLQAFASGNMDQQAAQAATWHVTDKMSWQELAEKKITFLGGVPPKPYFTAAQLMGAQQLIATVEKRARDRNDATPAEAKPLREPKL